MYKDKKPYDGTIPVGSASNLEGYCIDLIEALARNEPFEYTIYVTKDYGDKNSTDGTWNGVIGQLINKVQNKIIA